MESSPYYDFKAPLGVVGGECCYKKRNSRRHFRVRGCAHERTPQDALYAIFKPLLTLGIPIFYPLKTLPVLASSCDRCGLKLTKL